MLWFFPCRPVLTLDSLGKFSDLESKQAVYLSSLKGLKERKAELRKRENSQLYEEILALQEECHGISLEKLEVANQVHEQVRN